MQYGKGLRDAEVVVHRGGEGRGQRGGCHHIQIGPGLAADQGLLVASGLACTRDEALDPPVGGSGLGQRLGRVVDLRPVVRLAEVIPQLGRPHRGDHVVNQHGVAERLAHLLPAQPQQAVVHPVAGESVACRT